MDRLWRLSRRWDEVVWDSLGLEAERDLTGLVMARQAVPWCFVGMTGMIQMLITDADTVGLRVCELESRPRDDICGTTDDAVYTSGPRGLGGVFGRPKWRRRLPINGLDVDLLFRLSQPTSYLCDIILGMLMVSL